MNAHLRTGLWAHAFTVLVAAAMMLSRDSVVQGWLDPWLTFPLMPGFYLAAFWESAVRQPVIRTSCTSSP